MKKNILLSVCVLTAAVLCGSAFSNLQIVSATQKNDIFGYYTISGKAPKDFADISEIHLAGDYGAKQKPPFYGLIRLKTKNARDFKLLKTDMIDRKLKFKTTVVGGISYEFSGNFTKLDNFPENPPNGEVVLKGTLTKLKNGKKIAENELSFEYASGD